MQLVRDGDPRAFELVYDRHGGAAFSLAYRMVGDRRPWRRTPSRRPSCRSGAAVCASTATRGSVRTWVLGIVHHRTIDALRRNTVHDRRARAPRAWRSATRRTSARMWRSRAARRRAACARRLKRLPDQQRQMIELAYFGGFTHSQIAKMLDHADRHGEGPHAARPRKDARASSRGTGGSAHERPRRAIRTTSGAYLLGALERARARGVRGPPRGCSECQEEVARLRPAADALPRLGASSSRRRRG